MSSSEHDPAILQFVPFGSFVSPSFWHKLAEVKIDIDRLSDAPRQIFGYYTNANAKSCFLEVDYSAFNNEFAPPKNNYTAYGTLYNKNTIEDFKECNKSELLQQEGQKFLDDVRNGEILKNPSLLSRFLVLSFADLKVHKYYYWFAFPCLQQPIINVTKGFKPEQITDANGFCEFLESLYCQQNAASMSYFIMTRPTPNSWEYRPLSYYISSDDENFSSTANLEEIFFCFSDPCEAKSPSWLLRIYISFLFLSCPKLKGKTIQIVSIRRKAVDSNGFDFSGSLLWKIQLPEIEVKAAEMKFVGWEPNTNGRMGPRMASMADSMDPAKLAENSVLLNLKLMKWRILPDLNLDIIASQKCLIFGAGTLGCGVARNLLAWGFKTITFVDSGKVSFSNPVRQSLYRNEDALSGQKKKATTAAERIKEINPNITSQGHVMQIPMPGHPVGDALRESVTQDVRKIDELVKSHDVIFLLTDSRESRWLPTFLATVYGKIVINAALGFDSYLVMRYGCYQEDQTEIKSTGAGDIGDLKCIPGSQLGCYFCNDVTAPGDSQKDRTLDQQCTVTRPGVSNIASSYAVELLVAILQHPLKNLAPAYYSSSGKCGTTSVPEGCLGILPHSIRGRLSDFENILPATSKFTQCIACSKNVVQEYKTSGIEFLFKVFESAKYLEDLTGISNFEVLDDEIIECSDSDFE